MPRALLFVYQRTMFRTAANSMMIANTSAMSQRTLSPFITAPSI